MHLLEVVGMSVGGCQRNIVECKRDVRGTSEDCFIMENVVESSKQTKNNFAYVIILAASTNGEHQSIGLQCLNEKSFFNNYSLKYVQDIMEILI
jgi:hypothetical protein